MQKTKLLETEYKKASRLEELAQETELALDTSKYNQEMNLNRIQFHTQLPTINVTNAYSQYLL